VYQTVVASDNIRSHDIHVVAVPHDYLQSHDQHKSSVHSDKLETVRCFHVGHGCAKQNKIKNLPFFFHDICGIPLSAALQSVKKTTSHHEKTKIEKVKIFFFSFSPVEVSNTARERLQYTKDREREPLPFAHIFRADEYDCAHNINAESYINGQ